MTNAGSEFSIQKGLLWSPVAFLAFQVRCCGIALNFI